MAKPKLVRYAFEMRGVTAFLLSLAAGVLLTAAGLAFELRTLAILGVVLFGVAGLAWLIEQRSHPDRRIFLPLTITPEFLSGLFADRTRLQAHKELERNYLGKWIKVSGALNDVEPDSAGGVSVTFVDRRSPVILKFRKNIERLEVLPRGTIVEAQGIIRAITPASVTLAKCEIIDVRGADSGQASIGRSNLPNPVPEATETAETLGAAAAAPSAAIDPGTLDWSNVLSLTPGQIEDFMEGCAPETIAGLRVFAEHGPIIHASLLDQAGIENCSHFQGRVTKRTRTVTGNTRAFLFTWDDWQAADSGIGHYAVTKTTYRSLRIYFNLD